jgi:hypothetical protein
MLYECSYLACGLETTSAEKTETVTEGDCKCYYNEPNDSVYTEHSSLGNDHSNPLSRIRILHAAFVSALIWFCYTV